MKIFNYLTLFLCGAAYTCGQILDLDDSFIEKKQDRAWLVEFYAPWCGHCRKLEPTYHQVYLELRSSQITVAKVDATRFSRLASEFDVRGYPTIKFIHGTRTFTHNGERTKEGIVEFAKRAYGPQVRPLTSVGRLSEAKAEHANGAFFLYVGPIVDTENLYNAYQSVAQRFAVRSYFYAAEPKVMPSELVTSDRSNIIAIKDGKTFEFIEPEDKSRLNDELSRWINIERFTALPKIGGIGLNEMSDIGKMLVIFVMSDGDMTSPEHTRCLDIVKRLASESSLHYNQSQYQLVWMTDVDAAGNIVMSSIETPYLFVLDPYSHQFYIPDFPLNHQDLSINSIVDFLHNVSEDKVPAYGGTGVVQRFRRLFYDIWSTVYGIYHESPWLALMVFGIPTFVISIICYTLCCLEPADEDELNRGSDDEDDEGMIEPDSTQTAEDVEFLEDAKSSTIDSSHPKSE